MEVDEQSGPGGSSQIFCLRWIKREAAKPVPDKILLSNDELKQAIEDGSAIKQESESDQSDASEPESENLNKPTEEYDDLKEFDLDNYDNEEADGNDLGLSSLVVFASNDDDPYIVSNKDVSDESENEMLENEALKLNQDDNLLVCGRCERDCSLLEIHVYNQKTHDFYMHHDIPLSSAPLCMEWLDFDAGAEDENYDKGNFIAIGNINSVIEVWDIDVLNTIEPAFTLGVKMKKQRKMKSLPSCHTEAIMDLSWNPLSRHNLASSSADQTVALWDLRVGTQSRVFRGHREKVQSIEWRPNDTTCLLSGACDGRVIALDMREEKKPTGKWKVDSEIERLAWNPDDTSYFAASTDSGSIYYCDLRKPRAPLYIWQAHEKAIPSLTISSGLLYSASSDGLLKTWRLQEESAVEVMEKDLKMGMVHCFHTNPDVTGMLAIGGEKGGVRLWNASSYEEISKYLGDDDVTEESGCDATIKKEVNGIEARSVKKNKTNSETFSKSRGPKLAQPKSKKLKKRHLNSKRKQMRALLYNS
uniref:Periodic tryptophan protein 1 homolog n=1 Tax=Phallusia mammillata TaxID=59560 RepID=A0A6F9DQZ5_9ASCI|nr:periodic tryptophan protein 1 homolog [Phallusia mammillata]